MASKYRLQLRPKEGSHREFACGESIKTLTGAKRHAREWAKEVGDGYIRLIGPDDKVSAAAFVRDGALSYWLF